MRTIKKTFIAILAFAITSVAAFAQNDSFDKLMSAIRSESASFEYTFETSGKVKMTGSGTVAVQDKCFRLKGNGLEVVSDGESIWTLDEAAKELVIDSTDETGMDAGNPAQFLAAADKAFNRQLTTSSMVVLTPKDETEIRQIKLYLKDGAKPVLTKVSVMVSDGTTTDFTIKNMKYARKAPVETFKFDEKSVSKSYVVTDLR